MFGIFVFMIFGSLVRHRRTYDANCKVNMRLEMVVFNELCYNLRSTIP